ncbi:hypothetical protein A2641_01430 [Candidatus Nomurabacteria bacterium RIFCSPHIGHO2_01_FULL_37_25]|uniref:Transglycosylase SLT domain-containing protein n=1 Tax=Candidatus Nomurabacteria bacterium RIFCSPLOWO2_01_FULL_36_16 TaxID=1801767 RepID=A0A1F6WZ22_9BACT|nr:MAG: hypothetical protein A2641_01430 [Candidatus Nomurabacteria bacterium RIFCSPHIGHO2_01_FULL_37_25]OGI75373.1 MAG: hypothetical protein A3D36_02330 [Candidatus Nomurabacteria bacterium RIFCSPHIGHO2_02_FULL_36_29]OGI87120.1 MAG: hypothetical protein A3A91_00425 [Candidatus Nomurabacteria bacterium RIFCSPLOWO2_01_FULL_36_16]OGI97000.1 MAG: hypothetical protein A3I84_02440 [Candidatus Nomurabacteria bacterium RIFCSPLOWO2_02_FULL_36_8]
MIKKDKNKLRLEAKSKILVLGLILITLVGIFSPMAHVNAVEAGRFCNRDAQDSGLTPATCVPFENTALCQSGCGGGHCTTTACPGTPETQGGGPTEYTLLAPLPCTGTSPGCVDGKLVTFTPAQDNNDALSAYLNTMIKIFIGLCAVFSVVMIVIGGMEYMTSELAHTKEAGKEKIWQALLGLLIALGAYALLNTINPDLLKTDLKSLKPLVIKITDKDFIVTNSDGEVTAGDGGPINQNSVGTSCDSRTILEAAQAAGTPITGGQAATFSCLITPESGCKSVENYNWGGGSSAYGPYQILLQSHSECFETPACYSAAGISGPLNCSTAFKDGNPKPGFEAIIQQCKKAADNFTCSTGAAVCVYRKQGFSAWTADSKNAKQKKCIDRWNH